MKPIRLTRACGLLSIAPLAFTSAASAQLLNNGTFDTLTVGTAPDCATPAGAWEWPAAYITAVLCEELPEEYQIMADPSGRGNLLALVSSSTTGNYSCKSLCTR